jgi:hypothetical protein
MPERRQPEFDPDAAVRAVADELPDIETPVIHIQDLEPKPQLMLADDEQEVRDALAEFDKEYARLRRADR